MGYTLKLCAYETSNDKTLIPVTAQTQTIPFVELKLEQTVSESSLYNSFRPDAVIQANGMIIGFTNSASSDLIRAVGGLIHAE